MHQWACLPTTVTTVEKPFLPKIFVTFLLLCIKYYSFVWPDIPDRLDGQEEQAGSGGPRVEAEAGGQVSRPVAHFADFRKGQEKGEKVPNPSFARTGNRTQELLILSLCQRPLGYSFSPWNGSVSNLVQFQSLTSFVQSLLIKFRVQLLQVHL